MTESSRLGRSTGALVATVVAAIVVVAVIAVVIAALNADGGTAQATNTPSATEAPSGSPSASESPADSPSVAPSAEASVQPPADFLPPGSIARVVGGDVELLDEPSTGQVLATVSDGTLVGLGFSYAFANWGPVEVDGSAWYPVRSFATSELPPVPTHPDDFLSADYGWVPEAALELVEPRCNGDEPTLEIVETLMPWEQLACYGDREITLEGVFGCGGCGGAYPGTFEPPWLASPTNFDIISVEPQDGIGPMALRFPPDGPPIPDTASIVRVTGHFDDPAATDCVVAPDSYPAPIRSEAAVIYCREQFVVESVEVLGVDEDFPYG